MSVAVLSIVISVVAIAISVTNILLVRATERRIHANLQQSCFDAATLPADDQHDWIFVTDDEAPVRKFKVS